MHSRSDPELSVVDPLLIVVYKLNRGAVQNSAKELELVIGHTEVATFTVRCLATLARKNADMRMTATKDEAKSKVAHITIFPTTAARAT